MCFDGASNMSGQNKGLGSRIKNNAPPSFYINFRFSAPRYVGGNLDNFLQAGPKHQAIFYYINESGNELQKTFKSLSVTRRSCDWESVKALVTHISGTVK